MDQKKIKENKDNGYKYISGIEKEKEETDINESVNNGEELEYFTE